MDKQDYMERLITELKEIESLTARGYSFDVAEYNIRTGDELEDNLKDVMSHIATSRPSRQSLKVIVIRTG
jgi:hypothetical protein